MTATVAEKPLLRGVFHQWSFVVSIIVGAIFIVTRSGAGDTLSALVYSVTVSAMFGVSALFHRVDWSPELAGPMLQLDKSGIYLLIAGSFTPIATVGLRSGFSTIMLVVFWTVSAVFIVGLWIPWTPPYGLITATYIGSGSLGLLVLPAMWSDISPNFTIMVLIEGVVFVAGSFMLGLRRPNPWPAVFGYHEVWHVIVMVGASIHYVAIAVYVY